MQRLALLALIAISSEVVLYPGTLHAEDELPTRLAWHDDTNSESSAHLTPSTDGISNLYIPYLFVVLFTDTDICSSVFADIALKTQSILTSTPATSSWLKW